MDCQMIANSHTKVIFTFSSVSTATSHMCGDVFCIGNTCICIYRVSADGHVPNLLVASNTTLEEAGINSKCSALWLKDTHKTLHLGITCLPYSLH